MVNEVNGNNFVYTIKRGDNLTKIAKANNTTVDAILKLNPHIKNPNLIIAGKSLIVADNKPFVQNEDYSPNNMNMGVVTVNGEEVSQIGGKDLKTNFFANNLAALSSVTINDGNPATKIVVEIQAGKTTDERNKKPYDILNKVLGDHLDNNSLIVTDGEGRRIAKSRYLESTDLYKAFISEDVNGDNFTGEDKKLLSRGDAGNKVQLPSVEVDKNGVKYFTLHGKDGEILYFDSTGKQVTFENGVIAGATEPSAQPQVQPENDDNAQSAPEAQEFSPRTDYSDGKLNLGTVYINGQPVEIDGLKSNFYANNVNAFANETLNDTSNATRLDVQLNLGSQIQKRDTSTVDILKKLLGNNFDKASVVNKDGENYTVSNVSLADTDLYKAFVQVNGENFSDGHIVRTENGVNTIQLPALEADANGVKYYTLHTTDGKILYFNDKGEEIPT